MPALAIPQPYGNPGRTMHGSLLTIAFNEITRRRIQTHSDDGQYASARNNYFQPPSTNREYVVCQRPESGPSRRLFYDALLFAIATECARVGCETGHVHRVFSRADAGGIVSWFDHERNHDVAISDMPSWVFRAGTLLNLILFRNEHAEGGWQLLIEDAIEAGIVTRSDNDEDSVVGDDIDFGGDDANDEGRSRRNDIPEEEEGLCRTYMAIDGLDQPFDWHLFSWRNVLWTLARTENIDVYSAAQGSAPLAWISDHADLSLQGGAGVRVFPDDFHENYNDYVDSDDDALEVWGGSTSNGMANGGTNGNVMNGDINEHVAD